MFDHNYDARVRAAAFKWLAEQIAIYGDLPRKILEKGFILDNKRIPLIGPPGIFKPEVLDGVPLSITTVYDGPYDDRLDESGPLRYKYQGTDPGNYYNCWLRATIKEKVPLIYFYGIARGKYRAIWPVFVISDDPANLSFYIAVDDQSHLGIQPVDSRYSSRRGLDSGVARISRPKSV